MSGWGYLPDPERWPGRLAAFISLARSNLTAVGSSLSFTDFLQMCMSEEALEGAPEEFWRNQSEQRLRISELEYLASETFLRLVADGEAWGVATYSPRFLGEMSQALAWERAQWENVPGLLRPTLRLIELQAATWSELKTWPGVDQLASEARRAYAHGLYVAAAAAARVAAEQATLESLSELGLDEDGKPHAREMRLFDELKAGSFRAQPLDLSATRSALSGIRSLGNTAAHEGAVRLAALQETLMQLLPQALASLYAAVRASTQRQ